MAARKRQRPRKSLEATLRRIRLFATDVDGVLTDAGMYYGENGEELKKFNTRDGMGVALVREAGIKTAILTREDTQIVLRRAAKLRIDDVHVGLLDKLPVLRGIAERYGLSLDE